MNKTIKSRKIGNHIVSIKKTSNGIFYVQWDKPSGLSEYPSLITRSNGAHSIVWDSTQNYRYYIPNEDTIILGTANRQVTRTVLKYLLECKELNGVV